MLLQPTISRAAESDPALDQAQLYALGLDHVRRLSRTLWTDHNTHDPGITTLENATFALTDLAYRAQFPIEDLLASATDNAKNMAAQFFTARQVLPNRALTVADYRKLVIDLRGVKNAWISPAPLRYFADPVAAALRRDDPGTPGIRPVDVRGLYRVRIEYMDEVSSDAERSAVQASVLTLLQANRNLCEDFVPIEGVANQWYSLCAELELTPDADPVKIAARVHFEVERCLAPPVNNYSLAEMLAKRHEDGTAYTVQEIFEGPLLDCGFIDDAELAASELRTDVRLSDIIRVIMDIEGVRAVRDIVVNALEKTGPPGPGNTEPAAKAVEPADKWRLPVPQGMQPRLSVRYGRLVFYKRNLPVLADSALVKKELDALNEAVRAKLEKPSADDLPIPHGRYRDVARYHSFQQHFPAVYGLSDAGLPANADAQRQAAALQLKGYLLFFDQVMANYFAQLANVRELFSRNPGVSRTYFAQVVDSFREYWRIYLGVWDKPNDPKKLVEVQAKLAALLEDNDAALARRSRFLDHLLARFAEDFHHFVGIMRSAFGASVPSAIATKCAFLDDYPKQGGERGLAYNYTLAAPEAQWNSLNVSGLEVRLARLLGIGNCARRNLSATSYDMATEVEKLPSGQYRFRVKHPVSGKILLTSSTVFATPEAARAKMVEAITQAQRLEAYARKVSADGKHFFVVVSGAEEFSADPIEHFDTPEAMDTAIDAAITHLRSYYSGEGMYVIEHILLRPRDIERPPFPPTDSDDPFLRICVDPTCTGCADDDPYSYRVQIVLPAYAGRFHNMDFRRFVEETIRLETPAHVLPKICWVDAADMAKIEQAYRDWIPLRAGVASAQRKEKMDALIKALRDAKNIHPKQKLHDCGGGDDKPPFILNRNALGSED
jgi:hypothetical protein